MYYLGLDIGGTKLEAALVEASGSIVHAERTPTHAAEGADAVLERIMALLARVLVPGRVSQVQISALGVGVPGAVEHETGLIHHLVNLPGWAGLPLRDILIARFRLPVFMTNDANAAALGEYVFGNGIGSKNMLYVTASTGIGAGIIIDGKIVGGANGAAGEVGHMILHAEGQLCNCGNRGCWETLSSGPAIVKAARRYIDEGATTAITQLAGHGPIKTEHVFAARQQGDAVAKLVVDRALHCLGIGIGNLVNVLNPERVIIGGGVTNAGEIVLSTVAGVVRQMAYGPAKSVKIMPARLGAQAGVIGAAAVAMQSLGKD
jgi:glucokinase